MDKYKKQISQMLKKHPCQINGDACGIVIYYHRENLNRPIIFLMHEIWICAYKLHARWLQLG